MTIGLLVWARNFADAGIVSQAVTVAWHDTLGIP
jgi:hypothetical protein